MENESDADGDHDSTNFSNSVKDNSKSEIDEKKSKKKVFNLNGIILDDFMASDNLNECVDSILSK